MLELRKNGKGTEREPEKVALDLNDLDLVTGSGDPFENIPRVPEKEINPELRNDA